MRTSISLTDRPGDVPGLPRLDANTLDPSIRHGAILGALDGAPNGIELIAPHDPQPLLAQIEERWPGQFDVSYLERDTAWRLAIIRRPAVVT